MNTAKRTKFQTHLDFESTIKEDTDNPHVTYVYTTKSNPWIVPLEWNGKRTYEFNVPEDTIVNNYVIDVTK